MGRRKCGMETTEYLRCVVERITYQSDGYSVLKCRVRGNPELVTVVGTMPDTFVGSVLALTGTWKFDARYGREFVVATFEEKLPATVMGIEKYLGSGLIKGVGPRFAHRIVAAFGKDTLEIIEHEPERLYEVQGIGASRVEQIRKSWNEQKEIKSIMLFLQSHQVSTAHATRIFKTYGNDSIAMVTENPYRMADDIWGIGFRTADMIAQKLGFDREKYQRLRSGMIYTLNQLADSGHCYATRHMLLETGRKLLEVDEGLLNMTLDQMIRDKDVIAEPLPTEHELLEDELPENAIYLPAFFFSELGIARRIRKLVASREGIRLDWNEALAARLQMKTGMTYDEVQLDAIRTAVTAKMMVLTGGPGTGKSTTTMGILAAFREAGARVMLAAPTGRAAKRLSEVTGMEAKTIHRLLEFNPSEGYQRNEEKPLQGDVLILDECSMIDLILMYNLLKAVPERMNLIMIGDVDQLPSVGAGNVLRDIMDSGVCPVVRLTRIFRQAQHSRIITNAHRINQGLIPDMNNSKGTDFFFQSVEDPEQAARLIVDLVQRRLPGFYHVQPSAIQVLTPMQRGPVGAMNLNQLLQKVLRQQDAPGLSRGGVRYMAGDKVMQIRNNYDKEVFNGDIGTVRSVDTEEQMLHVVFDDRVVDYDISELDEIMLAYATTVHKAQGAEYPIVVLPVMMTHFTMLQRNLLYTAVTRARKVLMLVGSRKAVEYCVQNMTIDKRNTRLADRLKGQVPDIGLGGDER